MCGVRIDLHISKLALKSPHLSFNIIDKSSKWIADCLNINTRVNRRFSRLDCVYDGIRNEFSHVFTGGLLIKLYDA